MDTLVVILIVGVGVQIADYLSIRHLRAIDPGGPEFTLFARYLRRENRRQILLVAKIAAGVLVGVLYFGLIAAAENRALWEVYPWLRDGLLGSGLIGILFLGGARFLIATIRSATMGAQDPGESQAKDWARAVIIHAFWVAAIAGAILFVLTQSLLLVAAAGFVGLVWVLNPSPKADQEESGRDKGKPPEVTRTAKAVLVVCTIAMTALVSAVILSSQSYWLEADYTGTLLLTDPLNMRVFGRGTLLTNEAETSTDIERSLLNWFVGEDATLSGLSVELRGSVANITVWNQTSIALSASASQFYLAYQSLANCTRVGASASSYRGEVRATNLSTLVRVGRSMGINVTFDVTLGSPLPGSLSIVSVTDRSWLFLACTGVSLFADGREHRFNESVTIGLRNFGRVNIWMYLSYASSFSIYGSTSLTFHESNSRFAVLDGSAVGRSGIHVRVTGDLAILRATTLTLTWSADDLYSQYPPGPLPVNLEAQGARLVCTAGEFPGPILPATLERRLMEPEAIRLSVLGSLWSVGVILAVRIANRPSTTSEKKVIDTKGASSDVGPKIGALIMGTLLVGIGAHGLVDAESVAYYYSRNPVSLHVWYEQGVPEPLVRAPITLFLFQAQKLVGFAPSSVEYHQIANDGLDTYQKGDPRDWAPPGLRAHDTLLMSQGWPEPFHIIFRSGKGLGFGGVSNLGAVIFIPLMLPTSPLWILYVLWHEFGHALGLLHNTCSPVMSDSPDRPSVFPSTISVSGNYPYRGADLFGQARNGSVAGFADWGVRVDQLSTTSAVVTWRWTAFMDPLSGSIRVVEYTQRHQQGGAEYVWIDFVPADLLQWAFSEGEQAFLMESIAGERSGLVVPEGEC